MGAALPRPARGGVRAAVLWLLGIAALLLLVGLAWKPRAVRGLALLAPSVAGFSEVEENVWVEADMPEEDAGRVVAAVATAQEAVRRFFGDEPARAVVLACATEACFARFHGTGAAATYLGGRVLVAPGGAAALGNALAHVELEARLGTLRTWWTVPHWFAEGLAANVSDDPALRGGVAAGGDAPALEDLATESGWNDADPVLAYAVARAEVERWYARAQRRGLEELLDAVRSGEAFDRAYRELVRPAQ
jgi:hypothetical protein